MLHIVEVVGAWAKKGQDYEKEEELARPFFRKKGKSTTAFFGLNLGCDPYF